MHIWVAVDHALSIPSQYLHGVFICGAVSCGAGAAKRVADLMTAAAHDEVVECAALYERACALADAANADCPKTAVWLLRALDDDEQSLAEQAAADDVVLRLRGAPVPTDGFTFALAESNSAATRRSARTFVRMLREHPMYGSFLANMWPFRERVVPLRMDTVAGVEHVKAAGVTPDLIYVDADHHYKAVLRDVRACLRAFPNAVLVGDDYGNYKDVENAVLECAREFNKVVHVDQNHCWTYAPLQSDTGLTFRPKPKKGSSFASLLGSYGKK